MYAPFPYGSPLAFGMFFAKFSSVCDYSNLLMLLFVCLLALIVSSFIYFDTDIGYLYIFLFACWVSVYSCLMPREWAIVPFWAISYQYRLWRTEQRVRTVAR